MADGKSPEEQQKLVAQMREWLNSQPHLPKDVDDHLLLRFVHSCYYDVPKAKTAAELFFTIRGSTPELLNNRDPNSPAIVKTLKIVNLAQLKMSGNRNLWIWQLNDPGLEAFDYVMDAKIFWLSTDAWMLDDRSLEEEDIVVMDVKDISLKFLTKFNVSLARKIAKYQEDAMPIRLKQIHLVNAPPFIDKLFGLMKPFLKQEILDMVHFHLAKTDTLFKFISKDELPEDFGGTLPTMDELMTGVLDIITNHREKLITNLWSATIPDKKSKNKKESTPSPDISSFRSLGID